MENIWDKSNNHTRRGDVMFLIFQSSIENGTNTAKDYTLSYWVSM